MKYIETKIQMEHTLVINEDERIWLSGLLQNPLNEDEDSTTANMRTNFWQALNPPKAKQNVD
jgi:hypothetical protein